MASSVPRRMTLEAFLDWDDGTDVQHELIDGEIVAMAPRSVAHAEVVINVGAVLARQLSPPYRVLGQAGIARRRRTDSYYQPDLTVSCEPHRAGQRYLEQPRLVVEVLSPSTRRQDRDVKLDGYRAIPSVAEILFVWTSERRVQRWRRGDGHWIVEDFIGDAEVRLESIDAALPLAAAYENVVLEPDPDADGA